MEQHTPDLAQISLRPFVLSDADDLMVWATDERVAKFCSWQPYTSKDTAVDFIQNIPSNFSWCRAICVDDCAIGSVSVQYYSGNDKARAKSAELGYVLGSKYWGKGITTKAAKMAVETAFAEFPDLERLEALVDVENVASQKVLEKAGFQREGILRKFLFIKGKSRNMVMFSVLRDEI
ncbi:hypothetical protein QN277_007593 [Acacia crassicarpa]|uniref:N-acetyltransferase domain-containing protein n=1 Tax=Acacia crassicarpa TaxID=499986 RepID=A0AAE1M8Y9_9FABA|nr:hypothetical protein QN277_007593 [Acacia crassicarpa]